MALRAKIAATQTLLRALLECPDADVQAKLSSIALGLLELNVSSQPQSVEEVKRRISVMDDAHARINSYLTGGGTQPQLLDFASALLLGHQAATRDQSRLGSARGNNPRTTRTEEEDLSHAVDVRKSEDADLAIAAQACERDASRANRLVITLMGLALVLLGAVALPAFDVGVSLSKSAWQAWAVVFVALAIALLLLYEASRIRRSADELRRVARQLRAVPAYLAPLPPAAKNLLRAAMVQRLFPRLLDDSDPLRESLWVPSTDSLLATIDPSALTLLADMENLVDAQEEKTAESRVDEKGDIDNGPTPQSSTDA